MRSAISRQWLCSTVQYADYGGGASVVASAFGERSDCVCQGAAGRLEELNYCAAPTGSSLHLASELFKAMAGIKMTFVPYKGSGAAQIGLLGGEVHMMFPPVGSVLPHIKSGRARLLAVATVLPSAFLPGVPTVAASLPG